MHRRPPPIPAVVEYSPSNLRRYIYSLVFIAASMASVLSIFRVVNEATTGTLLVAAACLALACGAWWALIDWAPQVITIRDGVLEVARGPRVARFDLKDPGTRVIMGSTPRSPTWTTMVQDQGGSTVTIRASQVKALQFARIVEHHKANRGPEHVSA